MQARIRHPETRRTSLAPLRVHGSPGRTGLACGIVALIVYALTCAPGVVWQDSGIHQYRILTGQPENPFGLALSHPLHHWLGRLAIMLAPAEPAYTLNLLSALCGALGVGMIAAVVLRLTGSGLAAVIAAGTVGIAHPFWQMSVVTETYTLAAALMIVEWWLLLHYTRTRNPWVLVALFGVNGLHVADHLLGLLTLTTYGAFILERLLRRKLAPRWLPLLCLVWVITTAPYWTMAVSYYQRTGDLAMTISSALFGGGQSGGWASDVLRTEFSLRQARLAGLTFGYAFPSLAALIAIWGLLKPTRGRHRIFRNLLIAQTAIIFVFVVRYTIQDLYTFFVPVCALMALWVGVGTARLLGAGGRRDRRTGLKVFLVANTLLPIAVYAVFPGIAARRQLMAGALRDIPYRDEYRHFFQPWKVGDDSAAQFARAALEAIGPGGWLLGDSTTSYAVAYTYRVHGGSPNVRIYVGRRCLIPPRTPPLTSEELAAFLGDGGRAIMVPGGTLERTWGSAFRLEQNAPFVTVRPVESSGASTPTP